MPTSPDLQTQFDALHSAYVVLARHLEKRGYADMHVLANDLELMADVDNDSTWSEEHMRLAGALRVLPPV